MSLYQKSPLKLTAVLFLLVLLIAGAVGVWYFMSHGMSLDNRSKASVDRNYTLTLEPVPGSQGTTRYDVYVNAPTDLGRIASIEGDIRIAYQTGGVVVQPKVGILPSIKAYAASPLTSPTPTPVSGTPVPVQTPLCNTKCTTDGQCGSSLLCAGGYCRNLVCTGATDCLCPTPVATLLPTPTPTTGAVTLFSGNGITFSTTLAMDKVRFNEVTLSTEGDRKSVV